MFRRQFLSVMTLSALSAIIGRRGFAGCVQNYKSTRYGDSSSVQDYKVYHEPVPLPKLPVRPTRNPQPRSSCPNGRCPTTQKRIRLGASWVESRLGYTTPHHLITVHGWSPEVVAAYSGRLNFLHGSPDAPRNRHATG